ncbi:glycoside hydrolase superfamily [Xylariales sp. PMI_506]|nr:glycoside hydrolase superfamily [Xylariales sp. PMI_506]
MSTIPNVFQGPVWPQNTGCTTDLSPISADDFVAALNPGWNVGNTLDAIPDETSWGNPLANAQLFQFIKQSGFNSVRIPVTYAYHYTGSSPSWTIDPTWLQRVSDVVDMAVEAGLYVVTNMHHDSWIWAAVNADGANLTMIEEKIYASWYQIGQTLGCKSSMVAFEPINEPPCSAAADGAEINKINGIFLQALQDSGGFNTQRVVTLVGCSMDSIQTSEWFVAPTGFDNPYAIQYHYYSPYELIFYAWGATIWGSDSDKAALSTDLKNIRDNFTDVPLVIGEFSPTTAYIEPAARRKYMDFIARTALSVKTSLMLWDNGGDQLDRINYVWRDSSNIQILTNATAGVANSLSDSTTDASATIQNSSAYIFHQYGTPVVDQTLPFLLNGNSLESISTTIGTVLSSSTDYTVSSSSITFSASFLSQYFSSAQEPGSKANLTVTFSAGAQANLEVVQWDVPILESTSSSASASSGVDLSIPITWKGLNRVAAVQMVENDGTYLFDTWTEYLGPLQQGRTTYSGQWNWGDATVILPAATVDAVISAGKTTTFAFEFYPRVPGHHVNYTLTI